MTKKKTKTWYTYLRQPLSLKKTLIMILLALIVTSVNSYSFIITPPSIVAAPSLVSQKDLMDVLGSSVTLGQEQKESYTSFFNKPEVSYWQQITKDKPDYPDAYVVLATLAYNDHNCQLASSFINTAIQLDSVDQQIKNTKDVIDTCSK